LKDWNAGTTRPGSPGRFYHRRDDAARRTTMASEITTLETLADQINHAHEIAMNWAQTAIDRAIEVGRLLSEAKSLVAHGEWRSWVEANCAFQERQAQRYMRAYERREAIKSNASSEDAFASLNDALASIATPRELPPSEDDDPSTWRPQKRLNEEMDRILAEIDEKLRQHPLSEQERQEGLDEIPRMADELIRRHREMGHEAFWRDMWERPDYPYLMLLIGDDQTRTSFLPLLGTQSPDVE
jgi:hypothetical protein